MVVLVTVIEHLLTVSEAALPATDQAAKTETIVGQTRNKDQVPITSERA